MTTLESLMSVKREIEQKEELLYRNVTTARRQFDEYEAK